MDEAPLKSRAIFKLEGLMNLFLRVLALIFICFAMRYWLLVVGVIDAEIRFDTMPNHWKVAGTFFSVSYPIVALGLWGLFRWGNVIWFLVATAELIIHALYPSLYGDYPSLIIFHLVSLGTWLLYSLIEFIDKKRALILNNR